MRKRQLINLSFFLMLLGIGNAAAGINATLSGGYNNHYIVNGLSKTDGRAFAAFDFEWVNNTVDVAIGGIALPNSNGLQESHWYLGLGREFTIADFLAVRFDIQALRHQSSIPGIQDSTEISPKFALTALGFTPYLIGSRDFNLKQTGWIAGIERPISFFDVLTLTPGLEYGEFTDYKMVSARFSVSLLLFDHLEPFAEAGWYDNDFSTSKYKKIATGVFRSNLMLTAGLRWHFD